MVFNQVDEEQTAPQDTKAFEEFQSALQCIIASFVEYPQVKKIYPVTFFVFVCTRQRRRHGGLTVSALDSGSNGTDCLCGVFDKTLTSHRASLPHPGV